MQLLATRNDVAFTATSPDIGWVESQRMLFDSTGDVDHSVRIGVRQAGIAVQICLCLRSLTEPTESGKSYG